VLPVGYLRKNPGYYQGLEFGSVWGTSSSDVFAVGRQGTIIHYNGKAWSTMTSGTTDDILGVGAVLRLMFMLAVTLALSCIITAKHGVRW